MLEHMQTPLYKYTFRNSKIRKWVVENSKGFVLNLFAGKTALELLEIRNDSNIEMPADYHFDALDFINQWDGRKFDTIILDPPYSYRKSMEMYNGKISSRFNQVKDNINNIISDDGIVITFGYHSVSMGKSRGFEIIKILLMSHGGAIHDTIATIERKCSNVKNIL